MEKLNQKNLFLTLGSLMASLAIFISTIGVNTTCFWIAHQPELPKSAKKLRKF